MNTIVYIVLTSTFGNVRCVNTINIRKPMNLDFQVHTDRNDVTKNRQMEINSAKIMPHLIDIDDESALSSINFRANRQELQFTDFILEAAMILRTYTNEVLKKLFSILDNELGKSVYNGCGSLELVKLKGYLSDQLEVLNNTPGETMRDHLDNIINILKKEEYGDLTETVELVNSFYVGESDKFIRVLLALMVKKLSPGVNLDKVVRRTLRNLFLDHYCNLSEEIRRDLILTIEHYWKQFVILRVDNKIDRNRNKVTFVTPFKPVERIRKSNKKKRFKTVWEKIPAIRNKKYKSDSYEHTNKRSSKYYKLSMSSEEAKDYRDRIERIPEIQEFRSRSKSDSNNPVITNMMRDKNIQGTFFNYDENMNNDENQSITESVADESNNEKTRAPVKILKQTDLDKLDNIKALAEEINGMIASLAFKEKEIPIRARRVGKSDTVEPGQLKTSVLPNMTIHLKQQEMIQKNGPIAEAINDKTEQQGGASDSKPLLWRLPLQFVDGDISIIPQLSKTIKEDINDKEEDLAGSMDIKYK